VYTIDTAHESGFAASGGPDDRGYFARPYVHIDIPESLFGSVPGVQVVHLQFGVVVFVVFESR
jgi:hypothetical protein